MRHFYSDEEYQFLRDNVKGISLKELTEKFNKKFGTNVTKLAIQNQKNKLHIQSGYSASWYNKGRVPYNKGLKMTKEQYEKAKPTMFKKGNIPVFTHNVGDEIIDKNGYIQIKITQPNVWKPKARYIYEQHYGELDNSKQVIFADGNNRNFEIDNLIAVTKAEMLIMNQRGLYKRNKELTKVGANIAKLIDKTHKRKE